MPVWALLSQQQGHACTSVQHGVLLAWAFYISSGIRPYTSIFYTVSSCCQQSTGCAQHPSLSPCYRLNRHMLVLAPPTGRHVHCQPSTSVKDLPGFVGLAGNLVSIYVGVLHTVRTMQGLPADNAPGLSLVGACFGCADKFLCKHITVSVKFVTS